MPEAADYLGPEAQARVEIDNHLTAAGWLALAAAAAGYALDTGASRADGDVLGPGEVSVELGVEHSRFGFDRLEVRPGTTVRFEVLNTDPIAHELIVGDHEVDRRHATGTEPFHPPVPGELSVGPHETGSTTYTFDEPGIVAFACHLPGHLDYGMKGEIDLRHRRVSLGYAAS